MIPQLAPLLTIEQLKATLQARYAVKRFDPAKKISSETIAALEDTMVLTPSSYGVQPWKFVVVSNLELLTKLRAVSWNQPQVTECSHLVVMTTLSKLTEQWVNEYMLRIQEVRGVAPETLAGFKNGIMHDAVVGPRSHVAETWLAHQSYIALGQLMLAAATLGVDACPMEGLDPKQYDTILGLEGSGFSTRVACALGYRSSEDRFAQAKKVRFDRSRIIDRRE